MTKDEFMILASAIRTYYPKENILPNKQALELWYRELKDIPYEVAEVALREHVHTSNFSPSIAELRKTAYFLQNGSISDWGKGWEQVTKAISKYGAYRADEAIESMDELTKETVKRIGFSTICHSSNITAERANFRMIYEELAKKKENDMKLPEELRQNMKMLYLPEGNNMAIGQRTSESCTGATRDRCR